MPVIPGAGDFLSIKTTVAADKISIGERTKETFGEFLLGKEFKTVGGAFSICYNIFISHHAKITTHIGQGNAISYGNWYLVISFVKSFKGETGAIGRQIFSTDRIMRTACVICLFIHEVAIVVTEAEDGVGGNLIIQTNRGIECPLIRHYIRGTDPGGEGA